MTSWAQLLHFYQPPTQTHDVLRRVTEESYRPLLAVLQEHRVARVAVNMNGVLTEMLVDHGFRDVVDGLRELAERGQVELVGSGKFHPILPLIPASLRDRSIAENDVTNARLFGRSTRPGGFFPPELCYGPGVAESIERGGFHWVILSGVSCPAAWPTDVVYRTQAGRGQLAVLFRDDVRSNRVSFRETDASAFLADLASVGQGQPAYVVTAMDAETYGHHIHGWERDFLGKAYALIEAEASEGGQPRVEPVTPSELLCRFPDGGLVEPHASSWSTTSEDIAAGNPYPLWDAPGNAVHTHQWHYVEHCIELVEIAVSATRGTSAEKYAVLADTLLQPALHSCQFWWASRRPMWEPELVYRGFQLLNAALINASRAINTSDASPGLKKRASWRVAAANEERRMIELYLAGELAL